MNIYEAYDMVRGNKELVANFDRLYGSNLQRKGAPIELAIDDSTGKSKADEAAFIEFFIEYIWLRLLTNHAMDNADAG